MPSDPRPSLRERLTDGPAVGTFVKLPSFDVVDVAAAAGFDFVVVDLEHSELDARTALQLVRHAAALGLPALVRLAALDADLVNRSLEQGAAGVQLSTVRDQGTAAALRRAANYPPGGTRSVSLAQPAAGFGARSLVAHLDASSAAPPLLVGQIETATTESSPAEIAGELDVVFAGTTDLSVDLGHAGDLAHPEVTSRVAEIAAATTDAGRAFGAFANAANEIPALVALGARYIVVASDIALLGAAARSTLADVRSVLDRDPLEPAQ